MRFLPFLIAFLLLPLLAGCNIQQDEMIPTEIHGNDHNQDVDVAGYTINDETGGSLGGGVCCVQVPKKWKPGLKIKVSWSYIQNFTNPNPPPRQTAVVEIPRYEADEIGGLTIHFFPGNRIKAVMGIGFGGVYTPLPREDWFGTSVDQRRIDWIRENPKVVMSLPNAPTMRDREWAKQWGLIIEDEE
jgi:hypothetical protein